jgi:glycosyltransferase involved in cell wall biosynthesis
MNPTYSLLMTVKNAENYLAETLNSVFAQTLLPDEILIVDDQSTDGTLEIIESYGPGITLLKNERNIGMAAALNLVIPLVTKNFVTFLDGDDLWLPTKAEKQIDFLVSNPEYDAVCCAVLNFKKNIDTDSTFQSSRIFGPSRLFTATTFRKEAFDKFGLTDPTAGHFGWISDWWSKASDLGIKYGMLDEVLLHRRVHSSNSWVRDRELGNKTLMEIARRNIARRTL